MKKLISLIMLIPIYSYSLAPPPINLRDEIVEDNGRKYKVTFNNGVLDMCEVVDKGKYEVYAVFAYYNPGFMEIPPSPSFIIRKSNCPGMPIKGNVGIPAFESAGLPVPWYPTYEEWVKNGKPITRYEDSDFDKDMELSQPKPALPIIFAYSFVFWALLCSYFLGIHQIVANVLISIIVISFVYTMYKIVGRKL